MIVSTVDGACNGAEPVKASTDNGDSWSPFMDNLGNNWFPTLGVNASSGCFFIFDNNLKQPYKYCTVTGLDDFDEDLNSVEVYPNPVQDFLVVKSELAFHSIVISDVSGKVMISMDQFTNPIEIKDLNKGIYFLSLYTTDQVISKK